MSLQMIYALNVWNNYLFREMNIKYKRVLLRLRLEAWIVYIKGKKIEIDPSNYCKWCEAEEFEDWAHVLYRCGYLNSLRVKRGGEHLKGSSISIMFKLCDMNNTQARELWDFLSEVTEKQEEWKGKK